jgi:hypothetical protein
MKTTDITIISPEHRVGSIGKYNAYVNFCPFCYPVQNVDLGLKEMIGFGTDSQGFVVEVSECPVCFKKSHHHLLNEDSYMMFKIMKERYGQER